MQSWSQSRFTLWVHEMCLIVGLRPLFSCSTKAPVSSKMHNAVCWLKSCEFRGMWSALPIGFDVLGRCCGFANWAGFLLTVGCDTWITVSHKFSAGLPFMRKPASSEMYLSCSTAARYG